MEEKTEEKVDVFDGWTTPDDNFLEETLPVETSTETEKLVKDVIETELTEEQQKAEEEKKAAEDKLTEDTFSEWDDDEEDISEDPPSDVDEEDDLDTTEALTGNVAILNSMKEKGLLEYELEEGEELTDELASELIEDKWEDSINSAVEETMKELPDSVKELIKYSMNGGNPNELIAQMASKPTNTITDKTDISDIENQKAVVRAARVEKGEDQETIDTYIQFLEESGKLDSIAKKEFEAVIENKKQFTKQQATLQAERKTAQKLKNREFKKNLTELITSGESGVKLSRQEQKEMPDYIAEPTVQLENGNKISQLQSDIFKALNDKNKTVLLAKILKSDFDLSDFTASAKTEVVKKVKGAVDSNRSNKRNRSSQPKRKSLADML